MDNDHKHALNDVFKKIEKILQVIEKHKHMDISAEVSPEAILQLEKLKGEIDRFIEKSKDLAKEGLQEEDIRGFMKKLPPEFSLELDFSQLEKAKDLKEQILTLREQVIEKRGQQEQVTEGNEEEQEEISEKREQIKRKRKFKGLGGGWSKL